MTEDINKPVGSEQKVQTVMSPVIYFRLNSLQQSNWQNTAKNKQINK